MTELLSTAKQQTVSDKFLQSKLNKIATKNKYISSQEIKTFSIKKGASKGYNLDPTSDPDLLASHAPCPRAASP